MATIVTTPTATELAAGDVGSSAAAPAWVPRRLTKSQHNRLVTALADAFDHDGLARLSKFAFGVSLDQIASPLQDSLSIAMKLVDWAEAHGKLTELVVTAQNLVPGNTPLAEWSNGPRDSRPPPYRGLFAFREIDAEIFFGRNAVAEQLVEAVERRPLVAVIGPSGSGKSSVVFAGMVPRLRSTGGWEIASFRPRTDPFDSLAAALVPILEKPDTSETRLLRARAELAADLREGRVLCASVLHRIRDKHDGARQLLLIADQFEELLTLVHDDAARRRFLDSLLAAFPRPAASESGAEPPPLVLMPTLRADFLSQALSHPPLVDALQGADLMLGPMSREELRQAIERPAALRDVALEPGLADRLLDDVGSEPGNLPLLEFALDRLWDERDGDLMTHAAYDEIGELDGALATYAGEVVAGLGGDTALMRRVFTQLVRPGDGAVDTRRRATRADLGDEGWALVTKLATAKLVVTDHDPLAGAATAEVAHEALIQKWQLLRDWINHDRDFRHWQERLRENVLAWQEIGRDAGALLRGAPLAVAAEWRHRRGTELSETEQQFIDDSLQAKAKETARQQHIRAGLCALTALALVLAGYAFWQRSVAERQAQISLIQALSAEAVNQTALGEHELGALLARQAFLIDEAAGRPRGTQVDDALRRVLSAPQFGRVLLAHDHPVRAVVFAPTGAQLASADHGGAIQLWDMRQPNARPRLLDDLGISIYALAFAPGGERLAAACADGTIRFWDVNQSAAAAQSLSAGDHAVLSLAFNRTGSHLAAADAVGEIFIWSLGQDNARPTHPSGHEGAVRGLAFSPRDNRLASAGEDGIIKLWNAEGSGAELDTLEVDSVRFRALAFAPGGDQLAAGGSDGIVRLWRPGQPDTKVEMLPGHLGAVRAVAYDPAGTWLVSAGQDGTIRRWDLNHPDSGALILNALPQAGPDDDAGPANATPAAQRPPPAIWSLAFAPGDAGGRLATAGDDWMIRLWDLDDPGATPRILHDEAAAPAVAYAPGGVHLATGSVDGAVQLWKPGQADPAPDELEDDAGWVQAVAYSRDARWLAAASDAGVRLWDLHQRNLPPTLLPGAPALPRSITFSSDTDWLATGSDDGAIPVWDLARPLAEPRRLGENEDGGHAGWVAAVAFSPVDNRLASAGQDGQILLWNLDDPEPAATPLGQHGRAVQAVAFSPAGDRIASAGADGSIYLWDPAHPGAPVDDVPGNANPIRAITYSPGGDRLAAGSDDGSIRLWNPHDLGSAPVVLGRHEGEVWSLAFSSDGQTLASGGRDRGARLWLVETSALADLVCDRVWRNLSEDEWQRFVGPDDPREPTCPAPIPY